ncbi:MAG: S-layer homology domain-containing protein [Clostridia bacterium]|nr:S-layer homology domain-containing protein [Clostridia bacterium]
MIKNLKKVISTLAAVAILATSAAVSAVSFPDVDESAAYAGAVDALTTLGIVNGDDNGKFNPENTVTRAEFAKMVVESLGAGNEAASSTDTKFVDAKGHWAAGYIEVGVAKEFINGYDEKTFGPDDQVTYAQAVKMLVAAIGYETYASQQGGWPSGYLAYGSELDIIAGVTGVSNDTALTRAQCAVLIYNTLKAPICKVDGYEQNYKGEWVPKLEEMNGTAKGWQSLLTSKHDAYVVRGRVMSADKKEGTVSYNVEVAENFDGQYVVVPQTVTVGGSSTVTVPAGATAAYEVTAYVGTTSAAEMLYTYSEAIIQKDADTSEYTIVSITPYGAAKTVEFAAKDIASIAEKGAATPAPANAIDVKKENSNKTTTYKLDDTVSVYVNGEKVVDEADTFAVSALSATNKRGTVTLVDVTTAGSTSTDGKYDIIMVDSYVVAQVTDVRVKNDDITLRTAGAGNITWNPDDEDDIAVTFYKDGAEISYEDVKEDDVILVKNDSREEWYEIYVSDKTVSGVATGKSTTPGKEYLLVDGTKYEFDDESRIAGMDLNTEYILYLDAMGYVFAVEEGESSKNIGIVVGMYTKAGDTYPTVKMIDANGEEVTYEAKNNSEAVEIYNATMSASLTVAESTVIPATNGSMISKPADAAALKTRPIEYTISSGKIQFKASAALAANQAVDGAVTYKASTSRLDSYAIDATATKILDFDAYLAGNGEVAVFDAANFEDDGDYKAWVYDKSTSSNIYGLVLITSGTTSLKPSSALAVVTASGVETDVDGTTVQVLTVARNGEEDIEVLVAEQADGADADDNTDNENDFPEGTIIMYTVGAEGYVEDGKIHVIAGPAADYATMMSNVVAETNFSAEIANSYIVANANSKSGYSLTVDGNTDNDVEIYYGPVYSASATVLEILKGQTSGTTNVNNTEAFTLAGANVYTYSYDAIAGEGMSVTVGNSIQKTSTYKNMYADANESEISWAAVNNATTGVEPLVAFVRVVDGDVTDVVFYTAE